MNKIYLIILNVYILSCIVMPGGNIGDIPVRTIFACILLIAAYNLSYKKKIKYN